MPLTLGVAVPTLCRHPVSCSYPHLLHPCEACCDSVRQAQRYKQRAFRCCGRSAILQSGLGASSRYVVDSASMSSAKHTVHRNVENTDCIHRTKGKVYAILLPSLSNLALQLMLLCILLWPFCLCWRVALRPYADVSFLQTMNFDLRRPRYP